MNTKYLHHLWTQIRPVKVWYLVGLAVVSAIIGVLALRANNLHMLKLRDNVYAVDKQNGDVEAALQKLRAYVTTHMNTELSTGASGVYPPIQLKYTYERLQQSATDQANANNSQLYTEAQAYCEGQNSTDFSGHNRVPCIESYVSQHGIKGKTVPDALYKFDFVSPRWSPDVAGWSVAVTIFLLILALLRAGAGYLAGRFLD